jgi:hypothetical protein|tara:strand:- start:1696 stop:1869 length:174 start_codon:yes stop_codon:yes gene_type:complete
MQAVSTGVIDTVDVDADFKSVENVDVPEEVDYLTTAPATQPLGSGWAYQAGEINFSV